MKKLLIVSLAFTLLACETKKAETQTEESPKEQNFEQFKSDYIDAMWKMNPISASYQGVHDYDSQLPIPNEERKQQGLEKLFRMNYVTRILF